MSTLIKVTSSQMVIITDSEKYDFLDFFHSSGRSAMLQGFVRHVSAYVCMLCVCLYVCVHDFVHNLYGIDSIVLHLFSFIHASLKTVYMEYLYDVIMRYI